MSIADAVASASAYLTEHPDEARYRDSKATARLEHGLVVSVTGPSGETARTDMPTGIGGTASGPRRAGCSEQPRPHASPRSWRSGRPQPA
jgi:hypothetical protein